MTKLCTIRSDWSNYTLVNVHLLLHCTKGLCSNVFMSNVTMRYVGAIDTKNKAQE